MTTQADSYSFSRLSTFTECPRKYEYRYVNRVPEAFDTIEAFLGRSVHRVLAWIYEEREHGCSPTEPDVLDRFDREWAGASDPTVRIVRRKDSPRRRAREGREMVSAHYRNVFLNDRRRTVGIEEPFEVTLDEGSRYTGVIDRVAIDADETLHVIDYKTTSRPPTVHGEPQTLQIRSYGMGRMMKGEERKIRLSYQYLRVGTEYAEILDRTAADRTAAVLASRIAEVKRATEFPARPSTLCGWCGYREICSESGYADRSASTGPTDKACCPSCGGDLRERRGRHGAFLGCENYPECRYTRDPD